MVSRTWRRRFAGAALAGALTFCVWLAGCGSPQQITPPPGQPPSQPQPTVVAAPQPDTSGIAFKPAQFKLEPSQHRSRWHYHTTSVRIGRADQGLSCDIVGGADKSGGQYGGVRFWTNPPKALRLEMSFTNPKDILLVYVDGYSAAAAKQSAQPDVRWEWKVSKSAALPTGRETFVLVPGQPSGYFVPTASGDASSIAEMDVFVRIAPGAKTGFTLHKVEVAK